MATINFKLQVAPGNAHVYLEGECDDVWNMFEQLRKDGLLNLPAKSGKWQEKEARTSSPAAAGIVGSPPEKKLPAKETASPVLTLEEVVAQNPHFKEIEWLLIHIFFATKDGKQTIFQRNINAIYRLSGRPLKENQKMHFSEKIQSLQKKGFINKGNENIITLLPAGSRYAHALLKRHFGAFVND